MTAPALSLQVQGTGEVSADNLNTYEQTCNIFDDLRAFTGTAGIQVFARGGVAVNDGLGGEFYWDGSSTGTDDNLDIITPTGATAGRWLRVEAPYSAGISAAMQPVVSAATLALARTAMGVTGFLIGPQAGSSTTFSSTLTARATAGATITVTGAAVGDHAFAFPSAAMTAGTFLYADVTLANTVTPYFANLSGGTLAPTITVYVVVIPKSNYGF